MRKLLLTLSIPLILALFYGIYWLFSDMSEVFLRFYAIGFTSLVLVGILFGCLMATQGLLVDQDYNPVRKIKK